MRRRKSFKGSNTFNYTWEVELDEDDIVVTMEFEISYTYSNGSPSASYYDPPDPAELEIDGVELLSIQVGDQDPRDPTDLEKEACEKKFREYVDSHMDVFFDLLADDAEQAEEAAYDDYCERKYDEMREEGRL